MIKRLTRTVAVLLVFTFVACSYVAWSGITGREPVPIPEALGGGPNQASSVDLFSMDPYVSWSDAHVDLIRSP